MTETGRVLDGDSGARGAWSEANDRGLAHAADGAWDEAVEAFTMAVESLTEDLPLRPATHEPLAMVTGNLAHACFRAGRLADAIQHAQRCCTLRVAITGEDGMPAARARMDLAVMLAAAGRTDEGMTLVQRAIAAIEHRVGEEDVRLAVVLENAARIALSLGSPANAEPILLRLHALLHAHELSTSRAEALLAKVAEVRDRQRRPRRTPASSTPVGGLSLVPATPPSNLALPGALPYPTPRSVRATPAVTEVLTTEHLILDDLEPLEAVETLPDLSFTPAASLTPPEPLPVADAGDFTREYAHASIDAEAASWADAPVEVEPRTELVVHAASGRVETLPPSTVSDRPLRSRLDLDRGHTLALPTPGHGVVAMETPARGARVITRADVDQAAERNGARAASKGTPAKGTATKDAAGKKTPAKGTPAKGSSTKGTPSKASAAVVAPASPKSVELPMIIGTVVTLATAAGAVTWLLLR